MIESDGRRARGDRSRRAAVDAAIGLAAQMGLDGLSFAQVAERTGLSKSAVAQLFVTKRHLQEAVLEAAGQRFVDVVVAPDNRTLPGGERLRLLARRWLDCIESDLFLGGCLMNGVTTAFRASPDPLGAVANAELGRWRALLIRVARDGIRDGSLADAKPAEVVHLLVGVMLAADQTRVPHRTAAFARARTLVDRICTRN